METLKKIEEIRGGMLVCPTTAKHFPNTEKTANVVIPANATSQVYVCDAYAEPAAFWPYIQRMAVIRL